MGCSQTILDTRVHEIIDNKQDFKFGVEDIAEEENDSI